VESFHYFRRHNMKMRNKINTVLFTLFTLLSLSGFSQITFEKGYLINNDSTKTECYIKNVDWENNPDKLKYKISLDDKETEISTDSIQQFEIYDECTYVRSTVKIDRSKSNIDNLDKQKSPSFKEETLLLERLVDGNAQLYSYKDGALLRFFYSIDNTPITQLIYKLYRPKGNLIAKNNTYKQQLRTLFDCPSIKVQHYENLEYSALSLVQLFQWQNQCNDQPLKSSKDKKTKSVQIQLNLGIGLSFLDVENSVSSIKNVTFDPGLNFNFGLEFAYTFPFNKQKWEAFIAPSFQLFNHEARVEQDFVAGGLIVSKVEYKSILSQIGIRYRMFVAPRSCLFVNTIVLHDRPLKSTYLVTRADGTLLNNIDIFTGVSAAFGFGFFHKKVSVEMRAYLPKDILLPYNSWHASYLALNLLISYDLL